MSVHDEKQASGPAPKKRKTDLQKLQEECDRLKKRVKKLEKRAEQTDADHQNEIEKITKRNDKKLNSANKKIEKCEKQINKLQKKQKKSKPSNTEEEKAKKPRRRYKSKYTSKESDEMYRARGRQMVMNIDATMEAEMKIELENMNRGKNGRPYKYSDSLICIIGIWRKLTGKALRICEGAAQVMLGKENVPSYSQLSRRLNKTVINPKGNGLITKESDNITRLSIDGSGLVPAARGAWLTYKWRVKRGFIRLNVVIDIDTKQILSFSITDDTVGESPQLPTLLDQALDKLGIKHDGQTREIIIELMGDKAYDSEANFEYCKELGIKALIPVRVNAKHHAKGDARSEAVLEQLGGEPDTVNELTKEEREKNQKKWKKENDVGMRWAIEGVFSAFKRMLGESVSAIKWENVIKEISGMINIYNWMLYVSAEAIKST